MGCKKLSYYEEEVQGNLRFFYGGALEKKGYAEKNCKSALRFGFNGQEKDNEIKGIGNSLSFKYRIYDSRLGKFLSVDPLAKEYPWNSTYAFAENRVIDGIDLEGAERFYTADGTLIGKYGTSTQVRVVHKKHIKEAQRQFGMKNVSAKYIKKQLMSKKQSHSLAKVVKSKFGEGAVKQMAQQWGDEYNPKSVKSNSEYGSTLYGLKIDGEEYINYSEPNISAPSEGEVAVSPAPSGGKVVGVYADIHSHGEEGSNEFFSTNKGTNLPPADRELSNQRGRVSYLTTGTGKLKVYYPENYDLMRTLLHDKPARQQTVGTVKTEE